MEKKILLVEDDFDLAELTASYLISNGYQVDIVSDGINAVDQILQQQPDLVILDLMLPGLDGLEVCQKVRPKFDKPILMLTARSDNIDEILGLEIGADDYLGKPVEPRLLLAHIKALLRRTTRSGEGADGPTNSNAVLNVNGLELDNRSRNVSLNGQPITLSDPEYDLLWLLTRNAGNILSREYIFENLRGIDYDGSNRAIDINISRIRNKLGDNPSNPSIIKTIRNKGYLLVV
ncbi:response regulator transcription factor [Oceanospirillum beijerinckii]|uniref:response regulator transcription factor n=1 Tax=Oceanospirillum beijerinckii TaxID=64976 RepID=UPI000415FEF7|nr:response regulator transcription factor [Oceanospirillum beijerinckii]MAC48033.1 DNA-binding response regulator [Oceanospirillum sp.]